MSDQAIERRRPSRAPDAAGRDLRSGIALVEDAVARLVFDHGEHAADWRASGS